MVSPRPQNQHHFAILNICISRALETILDNKRLIRPISREAGHQSYALERYIYLIPDRALETILDNKRLARVGKEGR